MMTGLGMGFSFIGLILMLVFWGGLIVLAVWLVRALFAGNHQSTKSSHGSASSARQILDQRYARGEINREQYDAMKRDIE